MTELLPNIFAIEVPMVAQNIDLMDCIKTEPTELMYDCAGMVVHESLPPGTYSFICASLNLTEDEAATIVEYEIDITGVREKNYRPGAVTICLSCVESLHSLLRSKGLNPELNYAILRKQL